MLKLDTTMCRARPIACACNVGLLSLKAEDAEAKNGEVRHGLFQTDCQSNLNFRKLCGTQMDTHAAANLHRLRFFVLLRLR